MPSYLQIENISKSYGPKILFEHIGFNINEGDKIALIAPNGTGKTSLMRILAGKDKSDSGGSIKFLKDISIAFLEQDYDFDPELGIFDQIMSHSRAFTARMEHEALFNYELRVKQFLTNFKLLEYDKKMSELSGGEVKRVALTEMLSSEADFFIMDEPTNHLDIDAIEYLEAFLGHSRCTLLMVTHDRYFLDRVCNTVMELDHGNIYTYKGNYENFLEKRDERVSNYNAQTDKARNILRRELEWIRATPCARSGKAKYRIDAFKELKERAEQLHASKQMDLGGVTAAGTARNATGRLEALGQRLGTKIIDCKHVSLSYCDRKLINDFNYKFQRGEKVGIVGANGAGKSSLINLFTGNDTGGTVGGSIERGDSVKIGYYRQEGISFDEGQTVLETVNDTRLLNMFLFPHDMLNNRISCLSGGEKRRLYLLTVLMQQPNVLILDEPTNDLDIVSLNVLEEYLKDYQGTLIIVSHDRHFLDRLVDHLFVFCPDGQIKDFIGGYSEYRSFIKDYEASLRAAEKKQKTVTAPQERSNTQRNSSKSKLSWKQRQDKERIETELECMAKERKELEDKLSQSVENLTYEEIDKMSKRIAEIISLTDEMEMQWLELAAIEEG